eukprot:2998789-Amphidinium_carterae.1
MRTGQVGEKSYHLHAFLLARASLFFDRHISFAARNEGSGTAAATRGSDLTEVLPQVAEAAPAEQKGSQDWRRSLERENGL